MKRTNQFVTKAEALQQIPSSFAQKLRNNGILSIYNRHSEDGIVNKILSIEPYVWFVLGIVFTIFSAFSSVINKSGDISLRLSIVWIVFGILSLLSVITGKSASENLLIDAEEGEEEGEEEVENEREEQE